MLRKPVKPKYQVFPTEAYNDLTKEETDTDTMEGYTNEQQKTIEDEFEESSKMVGIKPITEKMINTETHRIIDTGEIDRKTDFNTIQKTAVKNLVTQFLRDRLKIDDATRREIQINSLQSSKTENSGIIYIKCETAEDASIITSFAKNLSKTNFEKIQPAIVHHVPALMYRCYQHCEKMLWKLRQRQPQQLMTKIRMGIDDFILRYKKKDDDTPWNLVPPLIIPQDAPRADFKTKDNMKEFPQTPTNRNRQPSNTKPTTNKPSTENHQNTPRLDEQTNNQNNKKHHISLNDSNEIKRQRNMQNIWVEFFRKCIRPKVCHFISTICQSLTLYWTISQPEETFPYIQEAISESWHHSQTPVMYQNVLIH